MKWDGLKLQNEFAELLNDTSTEFKALVLGWINDIIFDVSSRHNWPHYRVSLTKILTTGTEEQSLVVSAPGAPSAAVAAGGSLTADDQLAIAVTYYNPTKNIETMLGTQVTATPTGANLTVNLTSIPTTTETVFTQRRVYVRNVTDDGDWLLYSTITDMTTTVLSITSQPATTSEQPPMFQYLKALDGKPRIAALNRVLEPLSGNQLYLIESGSVQSGDPHRFAERTSDSIIIDRQPSATRTLAFYGFRRPRRLYASISSFPDIMPELKELIKAGVKWKGYEYRERSEKDQMQRIYNDMLMEMIQEHGRAFKYPITVQDVVGSTNGRVEV